MPSRQELALVAGVGYTEEEFQPESGKAERIISLPVTNIATTLHEASLPGANVEARDRAKELVDI